MLASLMIALLLLASGEDESGVEQLDTEHFYVIGWFCEGGGCLSTPRHLGENLPFDPVRSEPVLAKADDLGVDWNVVLRCAVVGTRFRRCAVEDDSTGSASAIRAARRIAYGLSLTPARNGGTKGKQALVSIGHHAGTCAPWRCVPTIPPPVPPAG